MVFQWFWGLATIGNDGFQWFSTIGPTMEWLPTIVEVYSHDIYINFSINLYFLSMVDKVSLVENISSKAGTANAKNCSVMLVSLRLGLGQLNLSRWNWDATKLKANLWAIQCFPCRLGFPPQLMHPPVLCNVWFVLCISSFPYTRQSFPQIWYIFAGLIS